ncbi:hypothetical protein FE257_012936 [Aspergillus nanangensis]|uniref:Uncharacterized protein n=1 Tax=Aspergillus nanangensis TaxID=2582783 RepID=A0AAD4CFB0_ASPNN|nr:hypothetical protein FE257_012936 [Aspergillus nanangensis]
MNELGKAAAAVLKHVNQDPKIQVGNVVLKFIESVKEYAHRGEDAGKVIGRLLFWKDLYARQWRQGAAQAGPPSSQSAGSSTSGVPHAELLADSEIVVKVRDDVTRNQLRKYKPDEIVREAEKTRIAAARKQVSAALGGAAFIAARQLPSGDIQLRVSSAAQAEVFWRMGDHWARGLRPAAYTMVAEAARLVSTNQYTWAFGHGEARILHLGWLRSTREQSGNKPHERQRFFAGRRGQSYATNAKNRGMSKLSVPTSTNVASVQLHIQPGSHRASSLACKVRKEAAERARQALFVMGPEHRVPPSFPILQEPPAGGPRSGGTAPQTPYPRGQVPPTGPAGPPATLESFLESSAKQKPKRPVGRPRLKTTRSEDTGLPRPVQETRVGSAISISQSVTSQKVTAPNKVRQSRGSQGALTVPLSDPEKVMRKRTKRVGEEEIMDTEVQMAEISLLTKSFACGTSRVKKLSEA